MAGDRLRVTRDINASAEAVFAVLTDPAIHASIDGTGWVCDNVDPQPLTASGQIFRMAMYHPNHPDGNYQTANWVQAFDPPRTISWATGYEGDDGELHFGGWIWRYDLVADGPSRTKVTLTYDWSATSEVVRKRIGFPPFGIDHLGNSLAHLEELASK